MREYVRGDPKSFNSSDSNPRSWKYVSDVLHSYNENSYGKETILPMLAGLVGERLAQAFWSFYANFSGAVVPAAEKILKKYSVVKNNVREWSAKGNTAALDSLCHQLMIYLQDPAVEGRILNDKRAIKNMNLLIQDLPAEFVKKLKNNFSKELLRSL